MKKKIYFSLALNILITAFEISAVILSIIEYGGFSFFKFYTQDSNILLGIALLWHFVKSAFYVQAKKFLIQ